MTGPTTGPTTAPTTAPVVRRRTAGWLAVVVLACLVGLYVHRDTFAELRRLAAPAVVLLAVGLLGYGALLAGVIRFLDRFRLLRRRTVLVAFAWGVLVATALAVGANANLTAAFDDGLGVREVSALVTALVAPPVEETAKLLAVPVCVLVAGRGLAGPMEGLLLGSVSGLGFQLYEDIGYAARAAFAHPADDGRGLVSELAGRFLTGIGGHWVYTAVTGLAVGLLLTRGRGPRGTRVLGAVGLYVLAMLLHFGHNAVRLPSTYLVDLVAVVVMVVAVRLAARDQWRRTDEWLAADPAGPATPGERAALRTRWTARRARRSVRRTSGRGAGVILHRRQRAQLARAAALGQAADPGPALRALGRPVPGRAEVPS